MPPPRRIGRPRKADLREIVNAVLYMASTGCQWRMLPKDFPPVSTVQRYFYEWRDSRLWQTIRFPLAMQTREREGREAQPSAGVTRRRPLWMQAAEGRRCIADIGGAARAERTGRQAGAAPSPFLSRMSAPMLSAMRAEDALIESRARCA